MNSSRSLVMCKGSGCTSTTLISAHIIPAAFARFIRDDGPNVQLTPAGARNAQPQLGEFDRNILCSSCDQKLGALDHYAIDVCKEFTSKHVRKSSDIFELPSFNGEKFASFVLAVLWRASVSKRCCFSTVDLGPYEARARDLLFGRRPLSELPSFSVMVQRYTSNHLDMEGIYTLPERTKFGNLNGYAFMLAGFRVLAKLDARPFTREFAPFLLNSSNVFRGIFLEFEQTREFDHVKKIAVRELIKRGR